MANISMEHVVAEVTLPHGIVERDVLLSGGLIGLLCAFQVGKDLEEFDPRQIYEVDSAWPVNPNQIPRHKKLLRHLGSLGSGQPVASDVSCVAVSRNSSPRTDGTMSKHFVITTLGNAHTPGCVYILDWSKPLDFPSPHPLGVGLQPVAKFNQQTLWTADCDPQRSRTAVGTNKGVALLDIETKSISWVLRSKSDVLSVQFDHSGNSVHCGLRNGAIFTADTRQRQIRNAHGSSGISMPSSVCSLASLKRWDQYLLGSSMDGSMKLYDNRLIKRGAVQSYEGNVNSHTRIQIGVDPSEKVVTSGGEDFCLRLWNIKSGEMLFKERFMNTVPSAVCWPRSGEDVSYWQDHCSGVWLGSYEGIFYMDWL